MNKILKFLFWTFLFFASLSFVLLWREGLLPWQGEQAAENANPIVRVAGSNEIEQSALVPDLGSQPERAEAPVNEQAAEQPAAEQKAPEEQAAAPVEDNPETLAHEQSPGLEKPPEPIYVDEVIKYENLTEGLVMESLGSVDSCTDGERFDNWPVVGMWRGGLRLTVDFTQIAEEFTPTKKCELWVSSENPGLPNTFELGKFFVRPLLPLTKVAAAGEVPAPQAPAPEEPAEPAENNPPEIHEVPELPEAPPTPVPVPGEPSVLTLTIADLGGPEGSMGSINPCEWPAKVELWNFQKRGVFNFSDVAVAGFQPPDCNIYVWAYQPSASFNTSFPFTNNVGETLWIGW